MRSTYQSSDHRRAAAVREKPRHSLSRTGRRLTEGRSRSSSRRMCVSDDASISDVDVEHAQCSEVELTGVRAAEKGT